MFQVGVVHRVDMQLRRERLSRKFAQALYQLLLQVVGHGVLCAEEDDAATRDGDSEVTQEGVRVGRAHPCGDVDVDIFAADNGCHVERLVGVKCTAELQGLAVVGVGVCVGRHCDC